MVNFRTFEELSQNYAFSSNQENDEFRLFVSLVHEYNDDNSKNIRAELAHMFTEAIEDFRMPVEVL